MESEESRRQIFGLMNRNYIRLQLRIRLLYKSKSNSCSELAVVNVADIWKERLRSYMGSLIGKWKRSMRLVVTTNYKKSALYRKKSVIYGWLC